MTLEEIRQQFKEFLSSGELMYLPGESSRTGNACIAGPIGWHDNVLVVVIEQGSNIPPEVRVATGVGNFLMQCEALGNLELWVSKSPDEITT